MPCGVNSHHANVWASVMEALMGLHLRIGGVSPEDIRRGIAAAEAVFHAAGISSLRQ